MIYEYDGRGEQCPVPLINLRLLLKKMSVDDECIIIINDIGSVKDIPKFIIKSGFYYEKKIIDNSTIKLIINTLGDNI